MGNGHDLAAAAPRAARQERMRDQLWVRGQIWHRYRRQRPWPVEILLDTCAGGGSYMSLALWRGLRKLLRRNIDTGSPGFLEAANPSDSKTPPMRILVSAVVPVLLESDYRVRNVVVRVVEDLPYGFIFGADHFRRNHSTLEFAPDEGFRPVPSAPWVPFHIAALDTSPHPNPSAQNEIGFVCQLLCPRRRSLCLLLQLPCPQFAPAISTLLGRMRAL